MGVVLKLCHKSDIYFRYYIEEPDKLTWNQVRDAARVLFGIADDQISIVYKDADNDEITVSNDTDLHTMFSLNSSKKSIKLRVFTASQLKSMSSSTQPPLGLAAGGSAANSTSPRSHAGSVSGNSTTAPAVPMPVPASVHGGSEGGGSSSSSGSSSQKTGTNGAPSTYQMPKPDIPA